MSTDEPNHIASRNQLTHWLLPTFWIVIGTAFLLGATRIPTAMVQDKHDPGPAAICMLCAGALVLLGILQAVQLMFANSISKVHDPCQNPTSENTPPSVNQAVIGVVGIALYIFAVFQMGFAIATFLFGVAFMRFLGVSWRNTILATTSCLITVYWIFIKLLGILLPTGRWDLPF